MLSKTKDSKPLLFKEHLLESQTRDMLSRTQALWTLY